MAIRMKTEVTLKAEADCPSHSLANVAIRDLNFAIDEPEARGGTNQGPTPTDTAIAALVGWFLIPAIMRLRVTSAYEILETRLGLSVRVAGSCFFLTLRLFWMSLVMFAILLAFTIIYARMAMRETSQAEQ